MPTVYVKYLGHGQLVHIQARRLEYMGWLAAFLFGGMRCGLGNLISISI